MLRKSTAEFIGTLILVFFGLGTVHTATLYGAQVGLWQIAIVWGLAVALGVSVSAAVSGGHLNPAMTLVFALRRDFPWRHVIPYWAAQFCGAFCAAAVLFSLFGAVLENHEKKLGVVRGEPGSVVTARCYGEYFSSPEAVPTQSVDASWAQTWKEQAKLVPYWTAFVAEMFGTAILALVVFALTDSRNPSRPTDYFTPLLIGLTIAMLISVIAPLTQAGFNPARDFGPRLFAYFAGWGNIAIPGPNGIGFLTVYVIAPLCGGVLGGTLYDLFLRRPAKAE